MCRLTQSTFIGMGAGLLVLFITLQRQALLSSIFKKARGSEGIDTQALLIITIQGSYSFIITGSAIQLFQIVDQMTFINVSWFADYSQKAAHGHVWDSFSANPNKITMISIAVATSIGELGFLCWRNYVRGLKAAEARTG